MKDNKKNILLIFSSYLPYHLDKAESIKDKANFLSVGSFDDGYEEIQKANSTNINNIHILFPDKKVEDISFLKIQIKLFIELLRRKEDKIFIGIGGNIRSYHPSIFIGVIFKRIVGKKVFAMFDTNFSDRERNIFKEIVKAFFLIPFSGALCSSPQSAAYFDFLSIKNKPRTTFGLNTFNSIKFRKEILNKKENPDQFIYVGRMSEEKNLYFLLEAYQRYLKTPSQEKIKLKLKMIGDGPQLSLLKIRAKELGLEDNIFMGVKNSLEISKELNKSKALLLPSFTESWGLIVSEAVAMSVPVIASDKVNSKGYLIRQMVNGLCIEPDNLLGWTRALLKVAEDEEFYNSLISNFEDYKTYMDVSSFREAITLLAK